MPGTNRLARETSPYLRQHADNPVDWFPWGEDAFAAARERDVPILLSVGYSACHWCHVMAHESFEDEGTAAVMNDLFVNVKVDREERPDVDSIYMEAVQSLTGHGGWPMTVFLAPDGKPFFGGTYFPAESRHGLPAFVDLCRAVAAAWTERRDEILGEAEQLTSALQQRAIAGSGGNLPGREALATVPATVTADFDGEWGGFGKAPKFPQAMTLDLLLRLHVRGAGTQGEGTQDADPLGMVTTSLDAMASGGIYDHVGGGFARYSVDAFWMVPHFEKMLYDQALLARAYLHAWQVTGEDRYRQVLDETIGYVLRDLRHPDGGLYSAEDADSEGEEGKFYVWKAAEIRDVLGDDREAAEGAIGWYGVTPSGNFEGSNILHRPVRGDLARPPAVERARAALFEARERRVRPGLDDKVLTEWNGLFLSVLAEAAAATGDELWRAAAVACGEHLLTHLRRDDGRWLRAWQEEAGARHLAYAADHAALVDAFTRLGELTGEARWTEVATTTAHALLDLFWDEETGGLFTTGHDAEALIARQQDLLDNATPAANSNAALALARLAALTGEDRFDGAARAILSRLAGPVLQHPTAFANLLAAADVIAGASTEVVVTGDRSDLVEAVQRRWLPGAVLAWGERTASPLWEGRPDGFAYVCEGYACRRPVETVEDLLAQLP
ncbi:MAG: thioredoxin domain-containing protein [Acidimicrobiales bacterium]